MFEAVLFLVAGVLLLAAGLYYFVQAKGDAEARKIALIALLIGAALLAFGGLRINGIL